MFLSVNNMVHLFFLSSNSFSESEGEVEASSVKEFLNSIFYIIVEFVVVHVSYNLFN